MKNFHDTKFSRNFNQIPISFIREILEVANNENMISFAGGLPNPDFFPVEELEESAVEAFQNHGRGLLQYAGSQGFLPLRKWIARRYTSMFDVTVSAENIVITSGSQQTIDIMSKLFINAGDEIIIEKPTYLGGIQAMSAYSPSFLPVNLLTDGPDLIAVEKICRQYSPKFMYAIPSFQNPSGICYSGEKRKELAALLRNNNLLLLEDDPYFELRFRGGQQKPIFFYAPRQVCWTGSFSKMIAPGIRLGWVILPNELVSSFVRAKQSTDLHTNNLSQYIVYNYLKNNNIDLHLQTIRKAYRQQCADMMFAINKHMGNNIEMNAPDGGMFLWLKLPENIDSEKLVQNCLEKGVAFVPGKSFYTDGSGSNFIRMNFSNSPKNKIEKGIKIIADELKRVLIVKKSYYLVL
jgi:2-aminoadipate transaminase